MEQTIDGQKLAGGVSGNTAADEDEEMEPAALVAWLRAFCYSEVFIGRGLDGYLLWNSSSSTMELITAK